MLKTVDQKLPKAAFDIAVAYSAQIEKEDIGKVDSSHRVESE